MEKIEKNKSAKISPTSHKMIMKNKGDQTVAEYVDRLIENVIDTPEHPTYVPYKCNKCKEIVMIPGTWEYSTYPDIESILKLMEKHYPHYPHKKTCDGDLYFYNTPIESTKSVPVDRKDKVFPIVKLDRKIVVIKKIIDSNGIENYFVGYLHKPYGNHVQFTTISLMAIYRNIELIGRRNRPEPLINTLSQILKLDLENRKDFDLCITKIFKENQIIPEGMFKEICVFIPAFRWTQTRSKTKYGTDTMYGDGIFLQNLSDLIEGKINWNEAFKRYKT